MNPYATYPLTWVIYPYGLHATTAITDINLNPPALLPALRLLACFEPEHALRWWTFASVALFLAIAIALIARYGDRIRPYQIAWFLLVAWFLLAPVTFDTLSLGQNYALLAAIARLRGCCSKEIGRSPLVSF